MTTQTVQTEAVQDLTLFRDILAADTSNIDSLGDPDPLVKSYAVDKAGNVSVECFCQAAVGIVEKAITTLPPEHPLRDPRVKVVAASAAPSSLS
ncbi:MAG: hypothetical protein EBZ69_06615 [Alphaproteobacteria bacterium]|nr:hypothetical protein [Alphaproteobacteria bacterium]NDC56465.1 hypothetical protein [Alphaproteobacteria bacterium]